MLYKYGARKRDFLARFIFYLVLYAILWGVFNKTRRFAACTQAVVILRGTSYIAIELNVLHFKLYEIEWNRYMCAQAILPLIAFLGIDL